MVKRRASYYLHDWYCSVSNMSNHFWLKFLYDTYDGSYRYHANVIEKKNGIVGCAEMIISQQIITIALCIFGTMLMRFLPFIIFSVKRKIPEFVNCIGRYLPSTVFGMLVIYCLKDVQFLQGNYGISKMISILVITILHVWKRTMPISITGGTICYMVLIQLVF